MLLLPYEHLTITAHLSPDDAQEIVADIVEPFRWGRFFWSGHDKPYQGQVSEHRFKITRVIHYRNSFLPVVMGKISPTQHGSVIRITMRPDLFVVGFMIFWFGNAGGMFINNLGDVVLSLLQLKSMPPISPLSIFVPGLFLAFGYALIWGGFKLESAKSIRFFRELFAKSGQEVNFRFGNRFLGMTDIQWSLLTVLTVASGVVIVIFTKLVA